MKKVVFICQANVGRSQMAEAFYNFHTQTTQAISAGVGDYREKYNHHPTAEIIATMKEKGIDISQQRINVVSPAMIDSVDQVIVLCAKALCPDFILKSDKALFKEIEDPHRQSERKISVIRDQIEAVVLKLIDDTL